MGTDCEHGSHGCRARWSARSRRKPDGDDDMLKPSLPGIGLWLIPLRKIDELFLTTGPQRLVVSALSM